MKVLTTRSVPIKKLHLPGDYKKIVNGKDAATRATSIDEVGLLQLPMVRKADMQLIFGAHRVAAHEILGKKNVEVRLVDCTDEELVDMRETENIERRHDPELQRDLLLRRAERIAQDLEDDAPDGTVGRPKLATTKAREQVASEQGVQAESLRRRESRQRKRVEAKAKPKEPEALEAPINTVGMEMDQKAIADVSYIIAQCKGARESLRACAVYLTKLSNSGSKVPTGRLDQIRSDLQEVSAAVGSFMPTTLCAYCKSLGGVVEKCIPCSATGWMGKRLAADVPAELWDADNPKVLIDGVPHFVSDLETEGEEEEWGA